MTTPIRKSRSEPDFERVLAIHQRAMLRLREMNQRLGELVRGWRREQDDSRETGPK
jgi:hypothetical protein